MSTDEEDDDDSKTFATCLEEEETNDEDDETKEKALFPYEAREEEIRQQFEKLRKQKGYWLKSILLGESGAPSIDMVSEIHIEGDDDCWVERFYVNKDRVRIRYFRSIGSNRFFRREPPCGASRIIYMWDLIRGYTLSPDEQKCMMERLDNLQEIVKNMEGVSEEEYLVEKFIQDREWHWLAGGNVGGIQGRKPTRTTTKDPRTKKSRILNKNHMFMILFDIQRRRDKMFESKMKI